MSETTTDTLAEIDGQADYTPPEGWRVLQPGETITLGDRWVRLEDGQLFDARRIGETVRDGTFLRRIEPEPQPVQIREGRWRTRGGHIRNITPTPADHSKAGRHAWHDAKYYQTWYPSGRYTLHGDHPLDLLYYLGPIEPQPDQTITPDNVAAEALAGVNEWPSVQILRRQLETTEAALLEQQQRNEQLVTHSSQQHMEIAELQKAVNGTDAVNYSLRLQLEAVTAESAKQLQQVEELRSEVSHVQGLWGESRRRVEELETLVADLRNINATTEKSVETAYRHNADLQHRLDTVAAEWAVQAETIRGLQTQLEAVKAELVQERLERNQWQNHAQRTETQLVEKVSECRSLRIELDALQQAPQAEPVAAVPTSASDRFEEGWDAGTARAIETIAEWLEPLRKGNTTLRAAVLFHLPHIMRRLTGLADTED